MKQQCVSNDNQFTGVGYDGSLQRIFHTLATNYEDNQRYHCPAGRKHYPILHLKP